jgi:hypothetical protein
MSRNSILNKAMKNKSKFPYKTIWLKQTQFEELLKFQKGGESKGNAILRAIFTARDIENILKEYRTPNEDISVCLLRLVTDFIKVPRMIKN